MSRLQVLDPSSAKGKTKELFGMIQNKLGMVPNMMRGMGNSPALLEGYLSFDRSLSSGSLGAEMGELIALAVAEVNQCNYCASAHTFLSEKVVGIDSNTVMAARKAGQINKRIDAALQFARGLVKNAGHISEKELNDVRSAGFSDAEVCEIVGHVAINVLTNYFNTATATELDFPKA